MTPLETIQALYEAFRTKDDDRFRALCTPNLEWRQNPGFPGGAVHVGPEAVIRHVFRASSGRWAHFGFEIDAMRAAGDLVFVTGAYRLRLRPESAEVLAEACHVYTLRDGLIARFQQYADSKTVWDSLTTET